MASDTSWWRVFNLYAYIHVYPVFYSRSFYFEFACKSYSPTDYKGIIFMCKFLKVEDSMYVVLFKIFWELKLRLINCYRKF